VPSAGASGARAGLEAAIQGIWERHRSDFVKGVEDLESAVAELLDGGLDEHGRAHAERQAHKLAGSLGMFGRERGTELARDIERALGAGEGPRRSDSLRLSRLVGALREELGDESNAPEPQDDGAQATDGSLDRATLLVIEGDGDLGARLTTEAESRGMRSRAVRTPSAARAAVAHERPEAVLLDLTLADDSAGALELLSEVSRSDPALPVLVLTSSDVFTDRVEVARRGALGFLPRSLGTVGVLDAVEEALGRRTAEEARILVVDDDAAVLAAIRAVLDREGVTVTTLDDPLALWDVLESVVPDLVVLDVDMPGASGIELLRTMRGDGRFRNTPVLFLTAHTDRETVNMIFESGADDYVPKPVVGPELRTRIENRLERIRLYRKLAERDGLTGVLNRRTAETALERLLRNASLLGQPICLAMLDLDHFKQVNDRYGHTAGDAVLRRFGGMLLAEFRGEDVVARWGGEEFLVGMQGMTSDDGVRRVAELIESFRTQRFTAPEGGFFQLSFSAGVAAFPSDASTVADLYRVADEALYAAKKAGRSCVLPAASLPAAALAR